MNEHADTPQDPESGQHPDPELSGAPDVDQTPVPRPTADPGVTQQHPLTQPVPQVQPPASHVPPAQPMADVADGDHPAPPVETTWAPVPAPGVWNAAAPVWGQPGPTPTPVPAPGGWGAGTGGTVPPTAWPPSPYGYYPAPPPPPARKRNSRSQVAVIALVAAVVALALGAGIGHATWPTTTTAASTGPSEGGGNGGGSDFPFGSGSSGNTGSGSNSSGGTATGAGSPSNVSGIAAKISPDLVDINTNLSYQDEQAAGTGIVLTSNGEVLTNNHVIDGATSISVTDIGNGHTYKGNVVGYDRSGDVAVVQLVGASGLQTASVDTSQVSVNEGVVGVGNAGGAGGTPSSAGGSVTALDQAITASDSGGGDSENLTGLIEMNCDIQPGDSGGSLVNSSGQVVGMDTAASTGSSDFGSTAQAYAIPISTALSVARNIEAGRASSAVHIGATGFLGIQVQDSDADGGSQSTTSGAQVDGTLPGSPGADAGLAEGDAVTGINNTPVTDASDLSNALETHHPGDVIHLEWVDQSGVSHTSTVTLAVGPPA